MTVLCECRTFTNFGGAAVTPAAPPRFGARGETSAAVGLSPVGGDPRGGSSPPNLMPPRKLNWPRRRSWSRRSSMGLDRGSIQTPVPRGQYSGCEYPPHIWDPPSSHGSYLGGGRLCHPAGNSHRLGQSLFSLSGCGFEFVAVLDIWPLSTCDMLCV